ncbi:hypothetical protein [Sulfuricurvum sp.]|uniref:hypothetical protein n=1 Tax=Sulfuricurvum sp. TaxID=2025608 RepID=UPI002D546816|nr:hypothetical protein [Sulfuricurvum sp.]HZF70679.1 hypothetical protein [Sulfuricurvum sp.]
MKTLGLIALLSVAAFATDYKTMNMEEMKAMRESVPIEERAAYQAEMQNRMQLMNQEERQIMQRDMTQNRFNYQNGSRSSIGQSGAMQRQRMR